MLYLSVQEFPQSPLEALALSLAVWTDLIVETGCGWLTIEVNVGFAFVCVLAANERRARGISVKHSRCGHGSNSKDAGDDDVLEGNHLGS